MQLYRCFVGQYTEFCLHNPLCCFSVSNTKGKCIFLYRIGAETFGYTLILRLTYCDNVHQTAGRREHCWNKGAILHSM